MAAKADGAYCLVRKFIGGTKIKPIYRQNVSDEATYPVTVRNLWGRMAAIIGM
jgi:hypothetical protein